MKRRTTYVLGMAVIIALIAIVAAIVIITGSRYFDEPAVIGKVIDAKTKQPIEGAVIYGYYATQSGSWAGGKSIVQMVKSFEAVTNAEGVFELPAWRSDAIKGDAISLFPMIVFYKPGYEMRHEQMQSIREWVPYGERHDIPNIEPSGRMNWLHLAHQLQPVSTEKDRYTALNDAAVGLQFIGECGWEVYAKTLLLRHNEIKFLISKHVAPENIDSDGYARVGYFHRNPFVDYVNHSTVDQLLKNASAGRAPTKCANPIQIFAARN